MTIDSTIINLPIGIDSYEKLRNALKEDISFTVFKNTNKRKLQSLKYIPERKDGDTSKFISTFVFVGIPKPDPNSLWKIRFKKELATYADTTTITLQHIKSNNFLGTYYYNYSYCHYYKFLLTEHTEGHLKSNDIINLSVKKTYENGANVFLRSHDVQFTIEDDTF
ncbi:hypothetical protein C1645_828991 [Glomus cerebriforme]|uniref:MIR domain-containing protein n=1 Tax=Glomus cerebriforme TaxID=658196 RepID=A0A397SUQ3_9GLOM|nr:hypothetical protein C1645_828991 [Glomus cerebriforme]